MILKAGTYTLRDDSLVTGFMTGEYNINFTVPVSNSDISYNGIATCSKFKLSKDETSYKISYYCTSINPTLTGFTFPSYMDVHATEYHNIEGSDNGAIDDDYWNTDLFGNSVNVVTISKDTEVNDNFGFWFVVSSDYLIINPEEETTPIAEITYNGQVIASLNAGETCTLTCAELPMETDIIVKVNG